MSSRRMSVAWARSSEAEAPSPRRPGTSSSTRRSKSSATSVPGSICICTYLRRKVCASASIYGPKPAGQEGVSVATELEFDVDPAIKREYGTPAADERVTRTVAALEANGFRVLRAADSAEAKRIILGLIPDGSQVPHGACH